MGLDGRALAARPPEKVDEAADRDGLLAKPPQGVAARGFWLARAVAAVPPRHWTARFEATPEQLVAAARATDWADALCEGWTCAALLQGDRDWLVALWGFWQGTDEKVTSDRVAASMLGQILSRLPASDAAARVDALLGGARTRLDLLVALGSLHTPWTASLGARWIEKMRRELRQASVGASEFVLSLKLAALALPPECFASALEPLDPPAAEGAWERQLSEFAEVLRLRHDLFQELVP